MTEAKNNTTNLITLSEAAALLGLKYHHARKILYSDDSIGCFEYGRKKLWNESDIIQLKDKHFVQPRTA